MVAKRPCLDLTKDIRRPAFGSDPSPEQQRSNQCVSGDRIGHCCEGELRCNKFFQEVGRLQSLPCAEVHTLRRQLVQGRPTALRAGYERSGRYLLEDCGAVAQVEIKIVAGHIHPLQFEQFRCLREAGVHFPMSPSRLSCQACKIDERPLVSLGLIGPHVILLDRRPSRHRKSAEPRLLKQLPPRGIQNLLILLDRSSRQHCTNGGGSWLGENKNLVSMPNHGEGLAHELHSATNITVFITLNSGLSVFTLAKGVSQPISPKPWSLIMPSNSS
ncbi:hypothetical protein SAMN05660686_04952 [Thalassobaculum litoreum DSM 18839]|uniref:Uncharacterized protein n=1 Tax=Thalassobaculum litoreum DSM 18839 TaxID=1123362 RepID=A0A8G2BMR6_9PROT|nr:hypothetical protein SAMN05660686_04952 [Thalassobaculum litoreum DSM 18839]